MGWARETFKTISEALGVRRYMIPATATAVAAGITAAYGWLRSQPGWDWLPALPHWAAFVLVLLVLVLVFILNYATKLRLDTAPEFDLSFDADGLGVVDAIEHQPVRDGDGENWLLVASGRYIRIQINSRSSTAISGILAFMTGLQFRPTADAQFTDIKLPQYIPLSDKPLEIYPGLPHLIDFAKAVESNGGDIFRPTALWPLVLESAIKKHGQYRFTIGVFSKSGNKSISVMVEWHGDWKTVKAVAAT